MLYKLHFKSYLNSPGFSFLICQIGTVYHPGTWYRFINAGVAAIIEEVSSKTWAIQVFLVFFFPISHNMPPNMSLKQAEKEAYLETQDWPDERDWIIYCAVPNYIFNLAMMRVSTWNASNCFPLLLCKDLKK